MTPEGWQETTLGALCAAGGGEIQTGPFGSQLHARDYVRHGVPVVMPQDIIDGRIDTSAIAQVRERDAARLGKHRLRANDVVYSRRGDVRKCALVTPEQEGWLCGTGCLRVRVGDAAYGPFVGAYLTSQTAQDWVENNAVGLTMLNLNTSILGRVPVTLPTTVEQQAIVRALEVAQNEVDRVEGQRARHALTHRALIERTVEMSRSSEQESISKLTTFLGRGRGPRYVKRSRTFAIGQRCVRWEGFDQHAARPHAEHVTEGMVYAEPGDVLVNSTGTGTLGRACVFDGRPGAFVVDGHVTVTRLASGVDPEFLAAYLSSEPVQRLIMNTCVSGSTNQIELERSRFSQLRVGVPKPDDQSAIVAALRSSSALERSLRAKGERLRHVTDALRADLLTGEVRV